MENVTDRPLATVPVDSAALPVTPFAQCWLSILLDLNPGIPDDYWDKEVEGENPYHDRRCPGQHGGECVCVLTDPRLTEEDKRAFNAMEWDWWTINPYHERDCPAQHDGPCNCFVNNKHQTDKGLRELQEASESWKASRYDAGRSPRLTSASTTGK